MSLANFHSHNSQCDAAGPAADEAMELALAACDAYHYISCDGRCCRANGVTTPYRSSNRHAICLNLTALNGCDLLQDP
jgi:hypothetical protein